MSRLLALLLSSFVIMILVAGHSSAAEPTAEKARTLRHVVLFKFKETSTEADVAIVGPHVDKVCVVDFWSRD